MKVIYAQEPLQVEGRSIFPFEAAKMRYIWWHAARLHIPVTHSLYDTVALAQSLAFNGLG